MSYCGDSGRSRGPGAIAATDAERARSARDADRATASRATMRSYARDLEMARLTCGPTAAELRELGRGTMRPATSGILGDLGGLFSPGVRTGRDVRRQGGAAIEASRTSRQADAATIEAARQRRRQQPGVPQVRNPGGGAAPARPAPTGPRIDRSGVASSADTKPPTPSPTQTQNKPGTVDRPAAGPEPGQVMVPTPVPGQPGQVIYVPSGGGGGGGAPAPAAPIPGAPPLTPLPEVDAPGVVVGGLQLSPTVLAVGAAGALGLFLLFRSRRKA